MRSLHKICILILLLFPTYFLANERSKDGFIKKVNNTIRADYQNFYSPTNLKYLFGEICISGIFANTILDHNIQDWFQETVRDSKTDRLSRLAKPIGNVYEPISIYLSLTLLGSLTKNTVPGTIAQRFGSKSLRAIIVGAPMVGILQFVLGASRPNEGDSEWRPFHDTNSVSGHAFMGAIPFFTISKMVKPIYLKSFFYVGSVATGLSRINDNKHYLSQVLAGWWIAYLAVNSLDQAKESRIKLCPDFSLDGWKMKLYLSL